jgi:hypothetical protein
MSFDFLDSNNTIQHQVGYQNPSIPNPQFIPNQQQVQYNYYPQPQQMLVQQNIPDYTTPEITLGPIDNSNNSSGSYVPNFFKNNISIKIDEPIVEKKKPVRKKKETGTSGELIRANDTSVAQSPISGTIEDVPTMYTYAETTNMLRGTLEQIDALNGELVQEFNNVRSSRTMKNKYGALTNISENIGSLISSKIAAIREINSSISKSNDLDYKKYKDIKAAQGAMDDDKYIADLYKSFITNPNMQPTHPSLPQMQMPFVNEGSIAGSGIIRANVDKSGNLAGGDQAYLNYMANLTPEQNLMLYENNPNVKQVVVFDHATGNKFFQMMDMSTGQVIPNLPVYDQDFMQDTTLDLAKGIAKNINLNQTFPIVQINQESVMNQY